MQPLQLGLLDGQQLVEFLLLFLVVLNMGIRYLSHRRHQRQAVEGGPDAITRFLALEVSTVVLVLASFVYMTIHYHGGMIISILAITVLISDFFEFEARKVEARNELPLESPRAAIGASIVLLAYVSYVALFFLVEPFWSAVV